MRYFRDDASRASRGLAGFILGLVLAIYLAGDAGPSLEVWGGLLP